MLKNIFGKILSISALAVLAGSMMLTAATPAHAAYPGGDCDDNAVVRCGVNNLAELKTAYANNQGGNLHAIYKYFNINSAAELDGMVEGRVTKTNQVWVGNQLVATGAVTTGRHNMSGSTKMPGVDAYVRNPSVSFRSDSIPALVKMNGKQFAHAVIKSCGNPVKGQDVPEPEPEPQPEPKRSLSIKKYVRLGTSDETDDKHNDDEITIKPGEVVSWYLRATNTGEADLHNVKVRDVLPDNFTYPEAGRLGGTGSAVGGKTIKQLVTEGINVGTLKVGQTASIMFWTNSPHIQACDEGMQNVAFAQADGVPEVSDNATVKICEEETPPPAPTEPQEPEQPQVQGAKTPDALPVTGAAGVVGVFSITSFLGFAAYKLKDFYLLFMR